MKRGSLASLVLVSSAAFCACVSLAACSSGSGEQVMHDAQVFRFDAGPARSDAGPLSADSGMSPPSDAGFERPDTGPFVDSCSACGPRELCGVGGDGDGYDNDCDGDVDEDCSCVPGSARGCFAGPPERRGVGTCADGTMRCNEFGRYSACTGGTSTTFEVCDGADNDCNGATDDGLSGCTTSLACPGPETAAPLTTHVLDGTRIFSGTARAWRWEIVCDAGAVGCPAPRDPTAAMTEVYFVSSGNYRVRLFITPESGEEIGCEWIVYVRGRGLRVELTWDTQGAGRGNTDLDLHLHRRSTPPGMTTGETPFNTTDDCYYASCKGSNYGTPTKTRWGLPDTADLSACRDAPQGEGARWVTRGACFNPRLDVDVRLCDPAVTDGAADDFCAPENINIDDPPEGSMYRIAVNYYWAHGFTGDTHPTVRVFCGGELRGSYGADPIVTLHEGNAATSSLNDTWLVGDVVFESTGPGTCGAVSCRIVPINIITRAASPTDRVPFGPDWPR